MVRREVAEASRNFVAQLAKMNDESAMMPQLIASFLEAHGEGDQTKGLLKLGKDLKEDFDRVRGSGLTEDELKFHDFKPGVALKFHQLIADTIRRSDESKTVDVANMTDQDLSSALVDVAVTQMLADEDMQAKVLARLFQAKPELRTEIMEMNGRPVIEPRVPDPIPVLDYDESTGDE